MEIIGIIGGVRPLSPGPRHLIAGPGGVWESGGLRFMSGPFTQRGGRRCV